MSQVHVTVSLRFYSYEYSNEELKHIRKVAKQAGWRRVSMVSPHRQNPLKFERFNLSSYPVTGDEAEDLISSIVPLLTKEGWKSMELGQYGHWKRPYVGFVSK